MSEPKPPHLARMRFTPPSGKSESKVVRLSDRLMTDEQPNKLSAADALRVIRALAMDSGNIVLIPYGEKRAKQRKVERRAIERCVQMGTVTEGPFLNQFGQWQVNLFRHAAGEELTCVVGIEWIKKVIVINTF